MTLSMNTSETDLANLMLFHLGHAKRIGDLETERSAEANAIRTIYRMALDATLRDFHWPFATKFQALGLVEANPTDEWDYSYQYPSDCLDLRRLLSGFRSDSRDSEVKYRIVTDGNNTLVYTNQADAQAEFTIRITDTLRYPPDFITAFTLRGAALVAPSITSGDPFKMGTRAIQMYQAEISRAQANARNEFKPDLPPESDFIRARN